MRQLELREAPGEGNVSVVEGEAARPQGAAGRLDPYASPAQTSPFS